MSRIDVASVIHSTVGFFDEKLNPVVESSDVFTVRLSAEDMLESG